MAAPAFVRATTGSVGDNTTVTGTFASAPPANRLLVAVMTSFSEPSGSWVIPGGWAKAEGYELPEAATFDLGTAVMYKITGSSEGTSYSFNTGTQATRKVLSILEISGSDTNQTTVLAKTTSGAVCTARSNNTSTQTSHSVGSLPAPASAEFISIAVAAIGLSTTSTPTWADWDNTTPIFTSVTTPSVGASNVTSHNVAYKQFTASATPNPRANWSPAQRAVGIQVAFRSPPATAQTYTKSLAGSITPTGTRTGTVISAGTVIATGEDTATVEVVGQYQETTTTDWHFVYQSFPVVAGRTYVYKGRWKADNAKQSHVKVVFYNNVNTVLSEVQGPAGRDGSWNWEDFNGTFTAPDTAVRAEFSLAGGRGLSAGLPGTTWFDELLLQEGNLLGGMHALPAATVVADNLIPTQPPTAPSIQRQSGVFLIDMTAYTRPNDWLAMQVYVASSTDGGATFGTFTPLGNTGVQTVYQPPTPVDYSVQYKFEFTVIDTEGNESLPSPASDAVTPLPVNQVAGSGTSDVAKSSITGEMLDSIQLVTSIVSAPEGQQRVVFDSAGLTMYDQNGAILFQIPNVGQTKLSNADVDARSLSVREGMSIYGANNEVTSGGKVKLSSTPVIVPSIAPSLRVDWPKGSYAYYTGSPSVKVMPPYSGWQYSDTVHHNGTTTTAGFVTVERRNAGRVITYGTGTGDYIGDGSRANCNVGSPEMWGYEKISVAHKTGDFISVLVRRMTDNGWYIHKYSRSNLLFDSSVNIGASLQKVAFDSVQQLQYDHVRDYFVVAERSTTNVVRLVRFTSAWVFVDAITTDISLVDADGNITKEIVGLAFATGETTAYVAIRELATNKTTCYAQALTGGAQETGKTFPLPSDFRVGGITFDTSRSEFRTIAASPNYITSVEQYHAFRSSRHPNQYTEAQTNLYVAYTWVDSATPVKETTISPIVATALSGIRRANLIVTPPTFPVGVGGFRVYDFEGSSTPAASSMKLEGTSTTSPFTDSGYNAAGAAPPTTNTFYNAALVPGLIEGGIAANTDGVGFSLRGDGRMVLGAFASDPTALGPGELRMRRDSHTAATWMALQWWNSLASADVMTDNTRSGRWEHPLVANDFEDDIVATNQSRITATYADLTTVGPTRHVWVGPQGRILVAISARIESAVGSGLGWMSFEAINLTNPGVSEYSPDDTRAAQGAGTTLKTHTWVGIINPMEKGSRYRIRAKYRGDGTNSASFVNRRVSAMGF